MPPHHPASFWDWDHPPAPELLDPSPTPRGFRIRLDLDDVQPPVWRRLLLPGDLSLDQVHVVIQEAMGWEDYHLHKFWVGPLRERREFLSEWEIAEGQKGVAENSARLDQVLSQKGDKLHYEYDFGDGWRHTMVVEEVLEEELTEASCLTGKRACPPEDCGGVYGFVELVRWVEAGRPANFDSPVIDAESIAEWLDPDWDPAAFDLVDVNKRLRLLSAPPLPLHPDLLELIGRMPDGLARELLSEPGWQEDTPEPSPDAILQMVEPIHQLLTYLGDEGVPLTGQGYLKPAAVQEIAEMTGVASWWIGKLNRESQTAPVSSLHNSIKSLKLARKHQGKLVPTKKGLQAREDPLLIWQAVADSLPAGASQFDRHAGWLSLLVVGAGTLPDLWFQFLADLLSTIGWSTDGYPLREWEATNPTLEVLEILTRGLRRNSDGIPPERLEAVAHLARSSSIFWTVGG
ncbi:plasmid pRiA4b ORF-3 family protein [Corynebacterium hylobatis]|uniref:Plasmid pRiA4b ORF-3 family protein n=1 Tax=Corynebacterium hylobatis TaxID=1859290 RepID=A0A430HUK9_9CORY|nr:plasmid pRiA4b ORF-3 family protein [Corynebacterium hylobatis]RSZ61239.1 plasmid pRiA4b ORF-3 family protein [Corynebacterium hylobatis]